MGEAFMKVFMKKYVYYKNINSNIQLTENHKNIWYVIPYD